MASSRRMTAKDSIELEEQLRLNDDTLNLDPERLNESIIQTMTHKNPSLYLSAALSKIPEKKMSGLSILDFRELLHSVPKIHSDGPGGMNQILQPQKYNYVLKPPSPLISKLTPIQSIRDRQQLKMSILTPNQPVPADNKRPCCLLV